jgi:broad specificity phosphatase PhoE
VDIPDTLIDLQRAADAEWARLAELTDNDERGQQGRAWYDAGARAQAAVTEWAREAARQSAPHPRGCS